MSETEDCPYRAPSTYPFPVVWPPAFAGGWKSMAFSAMRPVRSRLWERGRGWMWASSSAG